MSARGFHRRRFLKIAAVVPLVGLSARAQADAPVARWHGVALGASSQIIVAGLHTEEAEPIFAQARDEIARLEAIFSLYQNRSELSVLNRTGRLVHPAPELLEVLSLSRAVREASFGAFDPSVQPLWRARVTGETFALPHGDLSDVMYSADEIVLKPGMALTLNGIAQGYITDRIAALLRCQGMTDLVADAGEQRALGHRPGGGGWRVGIADPSGALVAQLALRDRALATSAPGGTLLPDGKGHIVDARDGQPADRWQTLSVTHDSAAVADALSTAACCLTAAEMDDMLNHFPTAQLVYRT
ncbi:FAD:protein FMN transferase [uncultured Roseobacter sp.]|uniref:FAD:protein FMN transferase n=1 Tax=uncultured Roseobacter sp. TaxID=114847 RepID=UPI002621483B|nr:FAD:protein FMN transferase [uncultured Roseobacter sp.]